MLIDVETHLVDSFEIQRIVDEFKPVRPVTHFSFLQLLKIQFHFLCSLVFIVLPFLVFDN